MKEVIIKSKIVGKESAIGSGKPIAFPDLSAYALRSDFIRLESSFNDFLEGDDTDNVINRWKELEAFLNNISEDYNLLSLLNGKADKATTLSGYGITDAYTKTNVDDLLKTYVTISGNQTIKGEKNFTGGLKVNGSPIYYDTDKKYWKLEGDLLVTGGVTMYGNEGTYTPSTIMDAIAVDGTTISKSGGVLKVIGGTGGGVADSVAWSNITGKPNFASVATSGKYSDLTGKPTLLSSFTDDVVSGKYLPLSGGTIEGDIVFQGGYLRFTNSSGSFLGAYNVNDSGDALYLKGSAWNRILHSGNYSEYALPLSGGTLHKGASISWGNANNGMTDTSDWDIKTDGLRILSSTKSDSNAPSQYAAGLHVVGRYGFQIACGATSSDFYMRNIRDGVNNWYKLWHSGNDGSGSGLDADLLDGRQASGFAIYEGIVGANDSSGGASIGYTYATQEHGGLYAGGFINFGTNGYFCQLNGNVSQSGLAYRFYNTEYGKFSDWKSIAFTDSNVASATKLQNARTIWGQTFDGTANVSGSITGLGSILGFNSIRNSSDVNQTNGIWVGNVFSSSLVSTDIAYNATKHIFFTGNVGIGTASPTKKLHIYDSNISNDSILLLEKGNAYDSRLELINSVDSLSITQQSTGNAFISLRGNHSLIFETSNSGRFTINSLGNVGIGTTSPSSLLHVNGDGRITDIHFRGAYINLNRDGATGGVYDSSKTALEIEATSGVSILRTYNVTRQASIALHTNGNIGIGTISPEYKLAVNGDSVTNNVRTNSVMFGYSDVSSNITSSRWYYASITYADEGKSPSYLNPALVFKTMNNTYQPGTEVERMRICSNGNLSIGYAGDKGSKLYVDGNILAYGGITMYSDQRKKTILNNVELSLNQIAKAPLIEHYYNSDEKKTTHVGSIAQYWYGLNDWFCKEDSEGYLTMEIQNAALASAISIARELDRYETKTDKTIKQLRKRICQLEEEIERLKTA